MLVNKTKVIKLLEEAVQGREKNVVHTCTYSVHDDGAGAKAPNCLVGQVLYRLDPAILDRINSTTTDLGCNGNAEAIDVLLSSYPEVLGDIRFTKPAAEALDLAQKIQDGRLVDPTSNTFVVNRDCTWGYALEKVKEA